MNKIPCWKVQLKDIRFEGTEIQQKSICQIADPVSYDYLKLATSID